MRGRLRVLPRRVPRQPLLATLVVKRPGTKVPGRCQQTQGTCRSRLLALPLGLRELPAWIAFGINGLLYLASDPT